MLARIYHTSDGWRLRDLGSTNGSWVDGRRGRAGGEAVLLHNGAWIMLGGVEDLLMLFESALVARAEAHRVAAGRPA